MDKILKKILKKINDAGYEAYLVGGYVRDYLLGIKSYDVDICTNALPKDLHKLFNSNNSNNYGGFNLKINNYNIDITTYREELKYVKRKPTEMVYINDLEKDIERRDFTINAICLDQSDKIIDLLNGIDDLNKHVIRMIGDIDTKIKEDPLRILRAIRFACVLDFDIEDNLLNAIKENYRLVETLSDIRIKNELTKILLNKNFQKGLDLLKECNILEILKITYDDINYVSDICGMWAQLNTKKNYAFTKQEIRNIINIRQILNKGIIDKKVLYEYGLYNSLVAGEILNINKKIINKMYNNLDLKQESDLAISSEEIMNILNISPGEKIKKTKNHLINKILNDELKNNNKELTKYLKIKG